MKKDLLEGQRILLVDDEPDILETLDSLLPMCDVEEASSFEDAKELLETRYFDMAVLDIMGVQGYELLEIANERNVIAVMLTAHALTLEDTLKSYEEGAASYIPKDEIANVPTFLRDILEAKEKKKNFWWRWYDRLGSFYVKKFGSDWQEQEAGKEFWEKFGYW